MDDLQEFALAKARFRKAFWMALIRADIDERRLEAAHDAKEGTA